MILNDTLKDIELDVDLVTKLESDDDLYADTCEEFVHKIMDELVDGDMIELMRDSDVEYALGGYITTEMHQRYPELVEVLLQWNSSNTYDQVIDFLNECNDGAAEVYMEQRFCQV